MFRTLRTEEIRKLMNDFAMSGVATIPNVLTPLEAEEILRLLHEGCTWHPYVHPNDGAMPSADTWDAAGAKILDPELAYRFYRTLDHAEYRSPEADDFCLRFGRQTRLFDTIGIITDRDLTESYGFFSKYTEGCFLSPHSDKGNGDLAFVLNLTQTVWQPIWGGCLHLLETDWRTVKRVVTPAFNELIVFDVAEARCPHYVSPVAEGVTHARYAFSGWFK